MSELHDPSRENALQPIEAHLNAATNLTRAVWELIEGGSNFDDQRTLSVLRQLADSAAYHASAALVQFNNGVRL